MSARKRESSPPRPRVASIFESWSGWIAVSEGKTIAQGTTRESVGAAARERGYRTRALTKRLGHA